MPTYATVRILGVDGTEIYSWSSVDCALFKQLIADSNTYMINRPAANIDVYFLPNGMILETTNS